MKIKDIRNKCVVMYYVKEMVFISPCRKVLTRICIYASIFGLSLLIFAIPQMLFNRTTLLDDRQTRFKTDLKYILIWKPSYVLKKKIPFQRQIKLPEGQELFIKQECEFINCYITYNKDLLREKHQNLDAVVFNARDIIMYPPKEIDLARSVSQKYIFYSLDSSERYPICDAFFDGFFNWTWTYKLNSDIPQPLLNIYDQKKILIGPKKNISWVQNMSNKEVFSRKTFNKTKAMAWIVPKCKTKVKYQHFLNELSIELKSYNYTLDLFGPCGNRKCPSGSLKKCYKIVEKRYFFQLVLEDWLSEDYISERMVYALSYVNIPVILGISDYSRFLPPGSYINAQSFDMKKLGAIIDYLVQYPSTYYYFFHWKNHYKYTIRPKSQVCELCTKLNSNYTATSSNVYKNFRKWWNPDYRDSCHQMGLNNMLLTD